jgi:glycosyltransferase involved in cell wall biosynthesis
MGVRYVKILYCNKYNFRFSGTEAYLFDLMALMREQGHQTALFSMADTRGEPTVYDEHFVPHIDFKSSDRIGKKIHLAAHAVYSVSARQKIGSLIEKFRPDIAHVRNIYHHLSPSIFWELKKRRIPVIYHLNDFKMLCPNYNMVSRSDACERCHGGRFWHVVSEGCYPHGRAAGAVLAAEAYFHRWLRTYERCVDRFLVPSEFVRDKLVHYGWEAQRIEVLPHFQRLGKGPVRTSDQNAPVFYFGRLSAEKGVDELIRAVAELPHVRLKIAGDGPERANLEGLVASLQLRNVAFEGHVTGPQLDRLIAESCFTVLPSRAYETLGKTILESYAQARAVVASDLGSRREFVAEGDTGLLSPVGNVAELRSRISYLYEQTELAQQMGLAGLEFVRRNHSPEEHYQKLVALYEEMVKPKCSRAIPIQAPDASVPGNRKVRVAFIGARGVIGKYSGIESYYEEVGSRLARAGHDVSIYCRTYFTPPRENYNGMRLVRLPTIRSKHLETAIHTLLSSVHVLFRNCDVVHYHALGPSLFSFLPRIAGKKTVVTVQGLDWQRKKWGQFASWILRLGEASAICLPHRTMVVSQTLHAYYKDRYGKRTAQIPNGAPLRDLRSANEICKLGLRPGGYVLFLGRFSPEKNCHLLIEAFGRLDTDVALVLAGGAPASSQYAQVLRRDAGRNVRFLDYVSGDIFEELLTNAMLLVLPSDMEGLSIALLEAMGAGVCVLASDIPENREVVDGAGFLFRPGDSDHLESMLRFLIADPAARRSAAQRGRERIREKYQWDEITKEVEQVYLEVMGRQEKVADAEVCVNRGPVHGRKAAESLTHRSDFRRKTG